MHLALVVDDIAFERRCVRTVLQDEGWAWVEAANGLQALCRIPLMSPHLLITDLNMPVMDGRSLLRELRRRCIEVPTIVVTSERSSEMRSECFDLGALAVLTKPWQPQRLIELIRPLGNGQCT